jgi:hypothetical protein
MKMAPAENAPAMHATFRCHFCHAESSHIILQRLIRTSPKSKRPFMRQNFEYVCCNCKRADAIILGALPLRFIRVSFPTTCTRHCRGESRSVFADLRKGKTPKEQSCSASCVIQEGKAEDVVVAEFDPSMRVTF